MSKAVNGLLNKYPWAVHVSTLLRLLARLQAIARHLKRHQQVLVDTMDVNQGGKNVESSYLLFRLKC